MTPYLPDTDAETNNVDQTAQSGAPKDDQNIDVSPLSETADGSLGDKPNRLGGLLLIAKRRWWLTALIALGIVIALLLALPVTRYAVLGTFIKKDVTVSVVDFNTQKPVTNAIVALDGAKVTTDNKGQISVRAKVGNKNILVTKKYYKDASTATLVGLSRQKNPLRIQLQATGRQVPVVVTDKITRKAVSGAELSAAGSEATTDAEGKAIIVVPADKKEVDVTVTRKGFNSSTAKLQITEQVVDKNSFKIVRSGKVYFLSKLSGNLDVIKTNLDGSGRQTVLAGTGKESERDMALLTSGDGKYLALKSKRDGGEKSKLFLIESATGKLTTMDEDNAGFSPVGWSGYDFVYRVERFGVELHKPKSQAFKSYNAERAKMTIIDETEGEGTDARNAKYTRFNYAYLLGDRLIYSPAWTGRTDGLGGGLWPLAGKTAKLVVAKADGTNRSVLKEFKVPELPAYYASDVYYSIQLQKNGPDSVCIQEPARTSSERNSYFTYQDGHVSAANISDDEWSKFRSQVYITSPSGKKTFWSESRDGKNTLFVGNEKAESAKQIASLSEYTPYGWLSDDLLLVSKKGSELSIMPVSGGTPIKVADYHYAHYNYHGYGSLQIQ